jgi:uncharacterized protein (DUF169 family)
MNYSELSKKLQDILQMDSVPVGIKLLKTSKGYENYQKSDKYTFCQFIMKARQGQKLLAHKDNVACANGGSALGFRPVPEKLMNGEFLSTLGSFQKEGAQKTMAMMPRFDENTYQAIALSPLDQVDFQPDIIVLETLPEHIMWLSLASIHEDGGRLSFSTSVSNGTCVDTTVVPHLTQQLNVSIGCYGCRNATNVPDHHLYAGFPGHQLEALVNALENINQKAMPRTREKRAYQKLS